MAPYDNEIYRGPPEAGPTLKQDIRSYGTDIYIVEAPQTTAAQDVPVTKESAGQQAEAAPRKKSRIAKALKLLASCTAAVVIATSVGVELPPSEPAQLEWPQFGPVHGSGSYSFNAVSENSGVSQVSIGSRTFRLTAQKPGLHLQWHESYNITEDGTGGGFYLNMESEYEGWSMILDFNVNPVGSVDAEEGLGQIRTEEGETLYVRAFYIGSPEGLPSAQDVVDNLTDYIRISTNVQEDDWGRVLLGESMYSETNSRWNGIQAIVPDDRESALRFRQICHSVDAYYNLDDLVDTYEVNGITWDFYCSFVKEDMMLWAVPRQEDIAFAQDVNYLLYEWGIDSPEMLEELYGSEEMTGVLHELCQPAIYGSFIEQGLCYIHLRGDEPTVSEPPQEDPYAHLDQWPRYVASEGFGRLAHSTSLSGRNIQFGIDTRGFAATAQRDDVFLFWDSSRDGRAFVFLSMPRDNISLGLTFSMQPADYLPYTVWTEDGTQLYLDVEDYECAGMSQEELASFAANLSDYFLITGAEQTAWNQVYIGQTMISTTGADWYGCGGVLSDTNADWSIDIIVYASSLELVQVASREVNGITWSFCLPADTGLYPYLYAVPGQEDIALGVDAYEFLEALGVDMVDQGYNWDTIYAHIDLIADAYVRNGLQHYSLCEEPEEQTQPDMYDSK